MAVCDYCGEYISENDGVKSYTSLITRQYVFCSQRCYEKSGIAARDAEIKKKYDNFVEGWISLAERKSFFAFIPRVLWFAGESFIIGGIVFLVELIVGALLEESSAALNETVLQFVLGWLRFVFWFAESGIKGILILLFGSAIIEAIGFQFIGKKAPVFGQNCCLILIAIGTVIGRFI
mgnify:CR=1 FL=1